MAHAEFFIALAEPSEASSVKTFGDFVPLPGIEIFLFRISLAKSRGARESWRIDFFFGFLENMMESHKQNGSPLQKDLNDSDQEEITGRTKVLVHQDALDIPEHPHQKSLSSVERPHLFAEPKTAKRRPSLIVEPDDVITPLSEESSPTATGKQWDDKPSVENYDTDENGCFGRIFPCCGDLIDPGSITFGRVLGLVINFLFYLANLVSDFVVCYHLFFHGNMLWFALVAAFMVIPTVILNSISYHLSISKMLVKRSIWNQSESILVSVIVALLHLSQFGVAARYLGYVFLHELEYLWVIFCPNEKRKNYDHRSGKYVELPYLPYLFMVEAILQCLPQLVVQLYILIVGEGEIFVVFYVRSSTDNFSGSESSQLNSPFDYLQACSEKFHHPMVWSFLTVHMVPLHEHLSYHVFHSFHDQIPTGIFHALHLALDHHEHMGSQCPHPISTMLHSERLSQELQQVLQRFSVWNHLFALFHGVEDSG
ncbi:XK-related protein [Caerostris darwini]|uniref:XK-related protein n=1 Tax=Caerostris darwini TaxID=1538125 RepID=A0AAV4SI48_9ARAC|nr:XK-related protein [Caerostris darwini]